MANLYLIERTDDVEHNEYASCVVCSNTEEEALLIDPDHDNGYTL